MNNKLVSLNSFISDQISGDWGKEDSDLKYDTEVYCVRGADINSLNAGKTENVPVRYIEKKKAANKFLEEGNIIIEISGGSPSQSTGRVGYVRRLNGKTICSNFCRALVIDQDNSPKYFYYLLSNIYNSGVFFNFESKTSGIKNLLFDIAFSNIKVPLRNEIQQQKIASILSTFDDKIELNNKINTELEQMTKTLYEYWFVQFDFPDENGKPYKTSGGIMHYNKELKREIPKDWEVKQLNDIILRSGTGLNPRDNFELGHGDNFYITIKNVKGGKIIFDDTCDRVNDEALKIINKRSDLQVGDVLFTSIEPVGITYFIHEKPKNWNINESVFTIRPNYEKITSEYLYMLLSSEEMKAFTKNASAGSIHKGIRHTVLKTFKLPYKNKEITEDFSKIVSPIFKRIYMLDSENKKLAELRDWLLPMLMNGQVTIK